VTAALALGTYRLRDVAAAARYAAACGTSWLDTAPNYLHGRAQLLLAPVLAEHPRLQVATKVGFVAPQARKAASAVGILPPGTHHSLHPRYVRWQMERNRHELGRDLIDTVLLHNPEHMDEPSLLHQVLGTAFTALERESAAGHLTSYGVATWNGFDDRLFTVADLDRLATEAAGSPHHHLKTIQLPVSLVMDSALAAALDGRGPIAEATARGWDVHASAPLHGGGLPALATAELADLLHPRLSIAQACLLAVASCPGVSKVLLSASTPAHWDAARTALDEPPLPAETLRKALDVLAPHHPD